MKPHALKLLNSAGSSQPACSDPLHLPCIEDANLHSLKKLRVLVLNTDMAAMGTTPQSISWAEAVTLQLADRVIPLAQSGLWAHSPTHDVQVPWVVMVKRFQTTEMLAALAHFNRWHLYLRDEGVCQYSGQKLYLKSPDPKRQATVDHVLPLSRGGTNVWENTVLAASDINGRKGAKTPKEAGLTLRSQPKPARVIDLQARWYSLNKHNPQAVPESWREFLEPAYARWKVAA